MQIYQWIYARWVVNVAKSGGGNPTQGWISMFQVRQDDRHGRWTEFSKSPHADMFIADITGSAGTETGSTHGEITTTQVRNSLGAPIPHTNQALNST